MFFKLIEDKDGDYVSSDGVRFCVSVARRVRTPQGVNVGYEAFPSLEEALAAWKIRPLASD